VDQAISPLIIGRRTSHASPAFPVGLGVNAKSAKGDVPSRRLGIRAIHADSGGTRIDFGSNPAIDTAVLIKQVQTDPRHYRLQGEKRLSVRRELLDYAERYELVSHLLGTLTPTTN